MRSLRPLTRNFGRWVVVVLVALNAVLGAMPALAQGNSVAASHSADARDQMKLDMVGEATGPYAAKLSLTAMPALDAPAVAVKWTLGEAQLLNGPVDETLGAVAKMTEVQLERSISFPGQGLYPLYLLVTYKPYAGAQYGASTALFASVDANGVVTLSDRDPNAVSPMHSKVETTATHLEAEAGSAGIERVHDDPCHVVTGNLTREDRVNTQFGQNAPTRVPVRQALLELRESDIVFDDSYGEVLTDANGNFSFPRFCDDDGVFDDELEFYIRIRAELRDGGFTVVEVEDSSWIDEVYEYDSGEKSTEGGAVGFQLDLNAEQSAVFNIADAVLDAYNFWNASGGAAEDDAKFDYSAEVHWEPGYGDGTSYYNGNIFDEMTIADSPDPDAWDDSVIMHEWGHMADDKYGCDDSPGGAHSFGDVLDPELAWGEGYPDYWQSAVRSGLGATDGRFYIDNDANGNTRISQDLEMLSSAANASIEDSVASMLWDLNDNNNDGQDAIAYGHSVLQRVYTHPIFSSNGDIFDDTCTANVFMRSWRDMNNPTDALTAAAVMQNIGGTNPFAAAASNVNASVAVNAAANVPTSLMEAAATNVRGGSLEDYIWWQRVTMVADNSASMAGTKFDAVKTVMKEQVIDLDDSPKGVEFNLYTFNNVLSGAQEVSRGRFFENQITPVIDGMATRPAGEAFEPCTVDAFGALANAIQDKRDSEAWLYTDGDAYTTPGLEETMQQMLTTRGLQASFVMMGGCNSTAVPDPDTAGATYNFLGKAAGGQSSGIVPYLVTALATGGNFLFVNESQLGDAGDILRAQLAHSAGAGRWSDYVSLDHTYRWDRLTSQEYSWVEPSNYWGKAVDDQLSVPIQPVTVYGLVYNQLQVDGSGYLQMGAPITGQPFGYIHYLDVLDGNLEWYDSGPAVASVDAPNAPDAYSQFVYSDVDGEWVVITVTGKKTYNEPRAYQVLINMNTGEIRYQYQSVPSGDSAASNIGISQFDFCCGYNLDTTIAYQQAAAATPGMGYKLTPAPPQPSKTYTVTVDSQMSGIGFLLTGYSGYLNAITVFDPAGNVVACDEAGSLCPPNLGLVQYNQFNVNNRTGDWRVVVSGEGTFSFTAMAASAIRVQSATDHQPAWGFAAPLLIKLGAAAENNQLTAWFNKPDGSAMGSPFTLYDDGTQGDGAAGDGTFGLASFIPAEVGVGYLWVSGTVNGTQVKRSDPTPYNFQPVRLYGTTNYDYSGSGDILVTYTIVNNTFYPACFSVQSELPVGWSEAWLFSDYDYAHGVCVTEGGSTERQAYITPASLQGDAPTGSTGDIVVTFREVERGMMVDSTTTRVTRVNPPTRIAIENHLTSSYLRPNSSDTAQLLVGVFDAQGYPAAEGTEVVIEATLGSVSPTVGYTEGGQVEVTFTSGNAEGDAEVKATAGALMTTTVVHIENALPDPKQMSFAVTPTDLTEDSTANLVVTVRDQWGSPVAGQIIRLGVDDDGESGQITAATEQASAAAIQAVEVVTLTTNAQGQASATFAKVEEAIGVGGSVGVRAQLLFDQGAGLEVVAEERRVIRLVEAVVPFDTFLFIPAIQGKE